MPYTFGAATSDRIVVPLSTSLFAITEFTLIWGWYLPSALTATRKYFGSAGGVSSDAGLEVDATTSELRFKSCHSTTMAEYVTSGAGIVTDKWQFIALMTAEGVQNGQRFWVGTLETPPAEVSSSRTVANAGGGTTGGLTIGNSAAGSPTQAFQGDIAEVGGVATGPSTLASPFFLASASAVSQTEADFILSRLVMPAWRGESNVHMRQGDGLNTPGRNFYFDVMLNALPVAYSSNRNDTTVQPGVACTVTGATVSQNGHPRGRSRLMMHPVRRRA